MKARNATQSLLLVLLVLTVALLKWRQEPEQREAFDRTPKELFYSDNARCQMECLEVDQQAIKEIMKKGVINFGRGNRSMQPCPVFALQGRAGDGQYLRVFFLQCPERTTVLNCYNLQKNTECPCPGED